MKQLKLLGLYALILSLFACGQTSKKEAVAEKPEDWKTLNESEYSIQYPDTFDLDKSGQMGMSFMLLSKQTSSQDFFRENVNLMIQNLEGQNIDLDKYTEISEGQLKTLITNGHLIESKRLSEHNMEFQRIVYTGSQGQYNLKWLQYSG